MFSVSCTALKKEFMNPKTLLVSLVIALLFWHCSDDNIGVLETEMETSGETPDFRLVAEDETSIFLYTYDSDSDEGESVNLTLEDNVDRFYISLRQLAEELSFFSLINGSFSLFQKNLSDQSTTAFEDFLMISSERSVIWGTVSEDQILMANYNPPGSGQLGIRSLDMNTGVFADTPLATNVADTGNPLYYRQRLFIDYLDNNDRYNMVVMDTENLELLASFAFENSIPSFLIDDSGDFVLLSGDQGNFRREVYDVASLDLIEESSFSLEQVLNPGPLDGYLVNERLYYQYILTQPSNVATAPAFFDFTTAESQVVDISMIRDEVIDELGFTITLTAFGFDELSRTYLMGYGASLASESYDGGVIVIDENGDRINVIELPFVPTYFIKN